MKFESKFGIGEIVVYAQHQRNEKPCDQLLEVQGIYFGMDGKVDYLCRYPSTGVTVAFAESQLEGDPEFCQESGYK